MQKTKFLTIFGTYGKLATFKKTLPSIVKETKNSDAKLIVHDSTEPSHNREEKWKFLQELNRNNDFFLILSNNMSMAHARNMCLHLGQELYAPDYICMLEDDHGMKPGFIKSMVGAMKEHYGDVSPNGLRYGLFTGCAHMKLAKMRDIGGNSIPSMDKPQEEPWRAGGTNSCCRCAPTQHWNNVLKGYDTDEYLISTFQTINLNRRNYNKGFTTMLVGNGTHMFNREEEKGRSQVKHKIWNDKYTLSDKRKK